MIDTQREDSGADRAAIADRGAPTRFSHPLGEVCIEEAEPGARRIRVTMKNPADLAPDVDWKTRYPLDLIELILDVKGPGYLCNEIRRDEDPIYVQDELANDILSYLPADAFRGCRVMDFGCGSGASTSILARLLSDADIVGVELSSNLLRVAEARKRYYGLDRVSFLHSTDPARLPDGIGAFDHVVMSAVYEHLLPGERKTAMSLLWSALRPGGVLFIDQTPNRFWPIETHTSRLPLINYLPDRLAGWCARRFSDQVPDNMPWETLLRCGLRGGSAGSILRHLRSLGDGEPVCLRPQYNGIEDRVDLWYRNSTLKRRSAGKRRLHRALKAVHAVTGIAFVPVVEIAVRKKP